MSGELVVGLQPLPLQARPPVLKESPRPSLALVAPQLSKGLLEQGRRSRSRLLAASRVLSACLPSEGEVRPARKQGIFLSLDEAAAFACEPCVLALADFIEGLSQGTDDVEFVVEESGLGRGPSRWRCETASTYP